jgi:hypothetical protein
MRSKRKKLCVPREEDEHEVNSYNDELEVDEDDDFDPEAAEGEDFEPRIDFSPPPDDTEKKEPLRAKGGRRGGKRQDVVRPPASSANAAMRQRVLVGVVGRGYRMYGSGYIRRLDL